MTNRTWRILIIDDNPNMTRDAERELHDAFENDELDVEIVVTNSFEDGFRLVREGACDVAVLDVRRDKQGHEPEDAQRGRRIYSDIRDIRFLPVIFWTALPHEVLDQRMPPLVDVLPKEDLDKLPDAVRAAINSGSVETMDGIEKHVATVMRDHMWKELAPNWSEDTAGGKTDELAHILITRVAHSLQDQALPELTQGPSHCYLYPPLSVHHRPGDLLRCSSDEKVSWWVVLTPACDLAHDGKAEFALLCKANPLADSPQYKAWKQSGSKERWNILNKLLSGKIARYHYFPKFREIPDLLLDLENSKSVPIADLKSYFRIASLVSPYCDALLTKHSHFRGRVGTPDLNVDSVKARLDLAPFVENGDNA
jgi:DNA-binding NarL/FixJ family response regulator